MSVHHVVETVLEAVCQGRPVLLQRDVAPREGYLVLAAEKAEASALRFLLAHGSGHLGIALTPERFEALGLPFVRPLAEDSSHLPNLAQLAVPVNGDGAQRDVGRELELIRTLVAPAGRKPPALPEHMPVFRAHWGGVLVCATPIDAAVDLARLAGLPAPAVLSHLRLQNGVDLEAFAQHHGLGRLAIGELIAYRRQRAQVPLVSTALRVQLPTRFGTFATHAFEDPLTGYTHLALVMGEIANGTPVLTRLHSECLTGDALGSCRCDCGPQLQRALEEIRQEGRGVLLYLRQEGRGIGLYNKLRAYNLQEQGFDTVEANEELGFPADLRDFGLAAQMLAGLGVQRIRLLTNNPAKIDVLRQAGMEVVERVPLQITASASNQHYLATKRTKLGHLLEDLD